MPVILKKDRVMPKSTKSNIIYPAPKLTGRCFETHKPLPLSKGLSIYGGSCITPVILDADIYIGFDAGIKRTAKRFPWITGHEIDMRIPDGKVPEYEDMVALVEWSIAQLEQGKKIHAGCIGGHGRTGTYLAVLVNMLMGEKDAGQYVRSNYCEKAIESETQIDFLKNKFGITPIKPRDYGAATLGKGWGYPKQTKLSNNSGSGWSKGTKYSKSHSTGDPVYTNGNIWGSLVKCN